jgi:hypothetical protein
MAGSDADVLGTNVDPEEEKKNCEGVLALLLIIALFRKCVRTSFSNF